MRKIESYNILLTFMFYTHTTGHGVCIDPLDVDLEDFYSWHG